MGELRLWEEGFTHSLPTPGILFFSSPLALQPACVAAFTQDPKAELLNLGMGHHQAGRCLMVLERGIWQNPWVPSLKYNPTADPWEAHPLPPAQPKGTEAM